MNGEALGWCPEPSFITLPYSCIEVSISQVKPEFEDMASLIQGIHCLFLHSLELHSVHKAYMAFAFVLEI